MDLEHHGVIGFCCWKNEKHHTHTSSPKENTNQWLVRTMYRDLEIQSRVVLTLRSSFTVTSKPVSSQYNTVNKMFCCRTILYSKYFDISTNATACRQSRCLFTFCRGALLSPRIAVYRIPLSAFSPAPTPIRMTTFGNRGPNRKRWTPSGMTNSRIFWRVVLRNKSYEAKL